MRTSKEDAMMNRELYLLRLQEALAKAQAAHAIDVRAAYLDLASFYDRKLADLHCCCASEQIASSNLTLG